MYKCPVFLYRRGTHDEYDRPIFSYSRVGPADYGWYPIAEFSSIKEFITTAKVTRYGFSADNFCDNTQYHQGTAFAFYVLKDDCGLVIDPSLIGYYYDQFKNEIKKTRYGWRRGGNFVFRDGPVENIHHYHGGHYYRRVRTTNERRDLAACEVDDDVRDYNIKIRGRRKELPDAWDDVGRQYHKNWKNFRKHQWK